MSNTSFFGRTGDELQFSKHPIGKAISRPTNAICDSSIFEDLDRIADSICDDASEIHQHRQGVGRATITGQFRAIHRPCRPTRVTTNPALMRRPKSLFRQRARKGTHRVDQYDPDDPRFVALHEAGHAVSAAVLGLPLESVDIKRRRMTNGTDCVGFTAVKLRLEEIAGKGEEVARPWLVQQLTGAIAESLLNERIAEYDGDRDDIRALHRIAALAICGRVEADGRIAVDPAEIDRKRGRLNAAVRDAYRAASDLVCAHLTALVEVANQLLRRRYLPSGDVAAIVHASIAPEPPDSLLAAREAARRIECRYGAA